MPVIARRRVRLAAIVGTVSLCSSLATPASAACNGQWDLSGPWVIQQTNGYTVTVTIRQAGPSLSGQAKFTSNEGRMSKRSSGPLSGTVRGTAISFDIPWSFPGRPHGKYTGIVDDQGRIGGTTYDRNKPTARAGWHGNRSARCVALRDPPAAKRATVLGKKRRSATVTRDVDLYDRPGGTGRVIGILRRGNTVSSPGCRADRWCQVSYRTLRGWVWGDHLRF